MGQEIDVTRFTATDFDRYNTRLREETALLRDCLEQDRLQNGAMAGGFEIETCLVDRSLHPAPCNDAFLAAFDNSLVSAELARFDVEFNTPSHPLANRALSEFHAELSDLWHEADACASKLDARLGMFGILPTLRHSDLELQHMSALNRYHALNAQVLKLREGRPLLLDIAGREHLRCEHRDVMLEAAATSFQIHFQVPAQQAHRYYNASILASAPLLAVGANSPLLFGKDLWDETRIPVFEQAVDLGGFDGAARGPLHRVGFGTGYAQRSIFECFQENLDHFPVMLPITFDEPPERFAHLRLHNGTIWRWNRPLIGFDDDGRPHVRIEQRVLPSGPTLRDSIANAAFFYGLGVALTEGIGTCPPALDFALAKDNFYAAARHSLDAQFHWLDGRRHNAAELISRELLPQARDGLAILELDNVDAEYWLGIIADRVESRQHGTAWQRSYRRRHGNDLARLAATYLEHQRKDLPVHQWPL